MNRADRSQLDAYAATALVEAITDLVIRVGSAILAVNRTVMQVHDKADGSPVTEADLAANRILLEGLSRLAPGILVISEECSHIASPYHDSFSSSIRLTEPRSTSPGATSSQ